ncbi:hypothetical protein [Bradyrhizobium sp. RDI18]|uniref:hypothetical protein n=1 Tax=Bradyrhizobium sp. RDI18 TaxID=3367400 RepID=UPI00372344B7
MEQPLEARMHGLLQISTDLHNRVAEIQKLREMVRSAEAAGPGQEPNPSSNRRADELSAFRELMQDAPAIPFPQAREHPIAKPPG